MTLLIYAFSTIFIFMAIVMVYAHQALPQRGILLLGFIYGASAVIALSLMQAWPLFVGFILVCVCRMFGIDPKPKIREANDSAPDPAGTSGRPEAGKSE